MILHAIQVESPFGRIGVVAGDTGVCAVQMAPDDPVAEAWLRRAFPGARFVPGPNAVPRQAAAELDAYFAGQLREFRTPLALRGTPFQLRVWQAVQAIPYGQVATYGEVAAQLGTGPRAVGGAVGQAPVSILLPCHRVVAAGGLGGYGSAPHVKRRLLELEGCVLPATSRAD